MWRLLRLLGRNAASFGIILFVLGAVICGMVAEAEEKRMEKAAKFSPLVVLITAALLLLLVSCMACSTPPQPSSYYVYGMRPFRPSAKLLQAYEFMEECTGEDGDFERIAWFRADSILSKDTGGVYGGLHVSNPVMRIRSIILAQQSSALHEILHDLGLDHDDALFKECLAAFYLSQEPGEDDE